MIASIVVPVLFTRRRSNPNLFTLPADFDNAVWGKEGSATCTANATTAPDGTLTADKIVTANGITSGPGIRRNGIFPLAATSYALSVYLKADGGSFPWVEFTTVGTSTLRSWFNTATGAIGTTGHASLRVETLSDGWYRVVDLRATSVGAASGEFHVTMRSGNGSSANITGDGTSGYFVWGAKLEAAAVSSAYP